MVGIVYLNTLLDLSVRLWPVLHLDAFEGADTDQLDKFTFKLAESKIEELNAISTTAALLAGVVATLYSWPSFDKYPWPAQALIGASFFFSLLSVRKAFKLSYVLRRLQLVGDWSNNRTKAADGIRNQLADKKHGRWIPNPIREKIWNSPFLFLNLATLTLLFGYAWGILAAAVEVSFNWSQRETQIAVSLITVAACSIPYYAGVNLWVYYRYCFASTS